jgi:hypothetical protein
MMRLGASMRQEVYRVALDEANAELSEISGKFELLRLRKDRVEKVVEALKPLVGISESQTGPGERGSVPPDWQASVQAPPTHAPVESVQGASNHSPYASQQQPMPPSDPFSRRSESVAGQGSPAKNVSEYSRLFNTGTSRGL